MFSHKLAPNADIVVPSIDDVKWLSDMVESWSELTVEQEAHFLSFGFKMDGYPVMPFYFEDVHMLPMIIAAQKLGAKNINELYYTDWMFIDPMTTGQQVSSELTTIYRSERDLSTEVKVDNIGRMLLVYENDNIVEVTNGPKKIYAMLQSRASGVCSLDFFHSLPHLYKHFNPNNIYAHNPRVSIFEMQEDLRQICINKNGMQEIVDKDGNLAEMIYELSYGKVMVDKFLPAEKV